MDPISILIEFQNGQIKVTGAINDKVLAYGLLEAARDVIQDHVNAQSKIVVPAAAIPALGRNGG